MHNYTPHNLIYYEALDSLKGPVDCLVSENRVFRQTVPNSYRPEESYIDSNPSNILNFVHELSKNLIFSGGTLKLYSTNKGHFESILQAKTLHSLGLALNISAVNTDYVAMSHYTQQEAIKMGHPTHLDSDIFPFL
jgi:hypothetical protein